MINPKICIAGIVTAIETALHFGITGVLPEYLTSLRRDYAQAIILVEDALLN